ncbi:MAG: DUF4123 domain-containing protein [Maritimibacter sp.]
MDLEKVAEPAYCEADWPEGDVGPCEFARIEGIEPLDAQMGAEVEVELPTALEGVFQAEKTLFALLDGAKQAQLPELLAASGLPYRCLFQGVAEEEWKSAAPWVVELRPGHKFTRMMFTDSGSGTPWEMWGQALGPLIEVAASLDSLRTRLRKFTRIETEAGDWLYFRFWERQVLPALAQSGAGGEGLDDAAALADALVADVAGAAPKWFFPHPKHNSLMTVCRAKTREGETPARPKLGAAGQTALDQGTVRRHVRDEIAGALADVDAEIATHYAADPRLAELRNMLVGQGFKQPEHRTEAISLYLTASKAGQADRAWATLAGDGPGPMQRLHVLKTFLKSLNKEVAQ